MVIIDAQLQAREAAGIPIQVALVGAGEMAVGFVNQVERHVPGMRIAGIFNRTQSKAHDAYQKAGVGDITDVSRSEEVDDAIRSGRAVVAESPEALIGAELIDVVVEMTGAISFAFSVVLKTFSAGKHVVSFNAELDATMGPYLQRKARESGVRYTLGDGDQPGVTMNLYRHVRAMGFRPLVCGNNKGLLDHYRTPETQQAYAEQAGISVHMATSFADGTKVSQEQACIANATGMQVECRGMRAMRSEQHVDELTSCYNVDELQKVGGVVDMVIGVKPGPGVFVYATAEDPVSKRFLEIGKLGQGPLYSFYIPYHLLFFEFPFSIVRLLDFSDGTLDARERYSVEVLATAKRAMSSGEQLDELGGFCCYGQCENRQEMIRGELLPIGLAEGLKLRKAVNKDQAITWNDVVFDSKDPLIAAYRASF